MAKIGSSSAGASRQGEFGGLADPFDGIERLNRPGFVGDFILWKRGWNHGQTQQDRSKVFG